MRLVFFLATALALLVPVAAASIPTLFSATGTAADGDDTGVVDGAGGMTVTAVKVNGTPLVEGTDYVVDRQGSSEVTISFVNDLSTGDEVQVIGTSPDPKPNVELSLENRNES